MKQTYLAIVVFSISVSLVGTNAVFAPCPIGVTDCGPPPGVTVGTGTDSQSYEKNDTITIQGRVYVPNYANPVTIQIINPNGTAIQRINVIVTNSTFSTQMQANFDTSGLYHTVTCVQSWCDRTYFKYIAEPYKITANGQDYSIWYKTVADLQGIEADVANNTLWVHIANGSGNITLALPRNLIDSKVGNLDSKFHVLVGMHQPDKYMQPENYTEIKTTDLSRTIQIQIPPNDIADMSGIWDFKITSNTRQNASSYLDCMDNMEQYMKSKYMSFDEEKAKTVSTSYDKFKSEVKSDRYEFHAISQEWTDNQQDCTATLKAVLVLFDVYDSTGKQRAVTVTIDPESYIPQSIDVQTGLPTHGGVQTDHSKDISQMSPLQQIRMGISPENIQCKIGMALVFKAEDGKSVCVKLIHVERLIIHGWAQNKIILTNSVPNMQHLAIVSEDQIQYPLKLYLGTNSLTVKPGQDVKITISVNNTLSTQAIVSDKNLWKLDSLSANPCGTLPYGIAIFGGFYTEQNMTNAKPLAIFPNTVLCPAYNPINQTYTFDPSSGHAILGACVDTESCVSSDFEVGSQLSFSGIWDHDSVIPFEPGLYTIAGGDEWGDLKIEHFAVVNSTAFAGNLGSMSCPMISGGGQFSATIQNYTGFANYYNSEQFGDVFFLHKGSSGKISVQYNATDTSWFQNTHNTSFNMANGAALYYMANATIGKSTVPFAISVYNDKAGHHSQICHYSEQHGGFEEPCNEDNTGNISPSEIPYASKLLQSNITTSFEPRSVMMYPGASPSFVSTVSTSAGSMTGTYWLSLEQSLCGPGVLTRLVVIP